MNKFIQKHSCFGFFLLFLALNIAFWSQSKSLQKSWSNVPPAPSIDRAGMIGLSDPQFAYRLYGTFLQNFGNAGGRFVNLREYDYTRLKDWFFVQDSLDERSNFTPLIAAHYFGAVDQNDKINEVLDYLKVVGTRPYGEKWRWLGHGVFLARYTMKDNERALELANILAQNQDPDIGIWARQMPAIIHQSEGNTDEAYAVMMNILKDSIDELHPNEINFMKEYICDKILADKPQGQKPELCQPQQKI